MKRREAEEKKREQKEARKQFEQERRFVKNKIRTLDIKKFFSIFQDEDIKLLKLLNVRFLIFLIQYQNQMYYCTRHGNHWAKLNLCHILFLKIIHTSRSMVSQNKL